MFKNSPLEKDVIARLENDLRIADSAEIAVAGDGGVVSFQFQSDAAYHDVSRLYRRRGRDERDHGHQPVTMREPHPLETHAR